MNTFHIKSGIFRVTGNLPRKRAAVSVVANHVLMKQDNLNMDIIFASVLMLCSKIEQILSTPLDAVVAVEH